MVYNLFCYFFTWEYFLKIVLFITFIIIFCLHLPSCIHRYELLVNIVDQVLQYCRPPLPFFPLLLCGRANFFAKAKSRSPLVFSWWVAFLNKTTIQVSHYLVPWSSYIFNFSFVFFLLLWIHNCSFFNPKPSSDLSQSYTYLLETLLPQAATGQSHHHTNIHQHLKPFEPYILCNHHYNARVAVVFCMWPTSQRETTYTDFAGIRVSHA